MAVFLIFYSYLTNSIAIGILVLFTHDPGDIFLDVSRVCNDTKVKSVITNTVYVTFLISWIFLRLYAFPCCIVHSAIYQYNLQDYSSTMSIFRSPNAYLVLMLSALVFMHVYWFVFIIRIALRLKTGSDPNIYDNKRKSR